MVIETLVVLALFTYLVWWVVSMVAEVRNYGACPVCKSRNAVQKTGRIREWSNDPAYQRSQLWTIKQIEWRCIECHYTAWHPGNSLADSNWTP